jgi:hypothetical protein
MKKTIVMGSCLLLCLLVLAKAFEKPLLAQIRAALTQNIDEPGRNPYQESFFAYMTNCAAASKFCNFTFSTVPAGKRLVITHVSAYVDVQNGMLPNCNLQSDFGGSQYAEAFFTGVRGPVSAGPSTRIFINQELQLYFGPGETPHGFCGLVSTTDSFSGAGNMELSGYYISNP